MVQLQVILVTIAVTSFIIFFYNNLDDYGNVSIKHLLVVYLLGILFGIPIYFLKMLFTTPLIEADIIITLIFAFFSSFVISLIEIGSILIIFHLFIRNNKSFINEKAIFLALITLGLGIGTSYAIITSIYFDMAHYPSIFYLVLTMGIISGWVGVFASKVPFEDVRKTRDRLLLKSFLIPFLLSGILTSLVYTDAQYPNMLLLAANALLYFIASYLLSRKVKELNKLVEAKEATETT